MSRPRLRYDGIAPREAAADIVATSVSLVEAAADAAASLPMEV